MAYASENDPLPAIVDNKLFYQALTGHNAKNEIFISLHKNDINAEGEIVDGWGEPLRVSYLPHGEINIVSAGRDKVFGTKDGITNQ